MNKNTVGRMIVLSLITATTIHATNGDNLIGIGAKARGMGGVSMGMSHGAESGLSNAALITSVEGTEISFGGTLFMPTIKTTIDGLGPEYTSDADTNIIPEVSIAHKINDNWYIGVGIWGTAGLGTDYSNAAGSANNFNMVTNLQLLQFGVPIAYKTGGLSLAVTPVMQYGNLDINYIVGPNPLGIPEGSYGAGLAQDFGFGYNLGFAYDFSANGIAGLTLGAEYKSAIKMTYDHQLSSATKLFADMGLFGGQALADDLEQPAVFSVGFAYEMGHHTFAFDYKKIKWSDAKGYKAFGWDNSNVYAFGYQYAQDNWALRAGYNRASSAVVAMPNANIDPNAAAVNFFNLLGFPANAEQHYTVGGSYEFTNTFSVDLAYVYSPSNTDTFDVTGLGFPGNVSTDHKENSLSFQLNYTF